MSVYDLFIDFAIASILIAVGQFLRSKIKFFQEFFIPASMIAGFIGLFLGSQFLNILPFSTNAGSYAGVLIIMIFTVVGINGFSSGGVNGKESAVKRVGGYTLYRFINYFIQFALGIFVTLTLFKVLFPTLSPAFGVLMASGFTGGHGTAAAVGKTLADLGWAEGGDLAMTFATIGILTGIFGGLIFIKVGTKMGWTAYIKDFKFISDDLRTGLVKEKNRSSMGAETISSVSLDTLAFHLSIVLGIAGLGYYLNSKVLAVYVLSGIPDFTVAFIIALAFFLLFRKTKLYGYVDKGVNNHISGTATDYLVFFGISTIKVTVVIEYAAPLLIMTLVGFLCVFLTMIPLGSGFNSKSWFERSLFCFGYCTGVFAIGFVLLRIVDPDEKSLCLDDVALSPWVSFAEIVSWSAVPAALMTGKGWLAFAVTAGVCVFCLIAGIVGGMWCKEPLAGRGGYEEEPLVEEPSFSEAPIDVAVAD